MKVSYYLLVSLAVFPAQLYAGSGEEVSVAESCRENLSPKILSPRKADECLEKLNAGEPPLMDKLRDGGVKDLDVLLRDNNALSDLGSFLSAASHDNVIREGLRMRLEKAKFLSALGLGPSPDKLYPWLDAYLPEKADPVKEATYEWGSLGAVVTGSLPKEGTSREAWAALTLGRRELLLGRWARKSCDELLKLPREALDAEKMCPLIDAVKKHLGKDYARINKLDELGTELGERRAKGPDKGPKRLDAKGAELEKAGIALKSSGDKKKALDEGFDNNTAAGGMSYKTGARPSGGKSKINPDDFALDDAAGKVIVEKLKPALFGPKGEFSDTQVGRSVSEYYTKAGKINLVIGDTGGDKGSFNNKTREILVSRNVVQSWLMDNHCTAEELQKDPARMAAFARYFAPLIVHEGGGHERDFDWSTGKKLPEIYHDGDEKRAFSLQALFVAQKNAAEKAKGNPYYLSQIGADDAKTADILREKGLDGITQFITPYYFTKAPSLAGRAAEQFSRCEQLKKELALRDLRVKQDPAREALADEQRSDLSKTAALRAEYARLYEWYKLSYAKGAADAREVMDGMAALNASSRKL